MTFKELFRSTYRSALLAARANDVEGVVSGLSDLYELFARQYKMENGDSIVIKAKLSFWQETFSTYTQIARQYGLKDRRIQSLFGFIKDDSAPSFSDLLNGKSAPGVTPNAPASAAVPPDGGVDIAGIVPPKEAAPKIDEPVSPPAPIDAAPSENEKPIPDGAGTPGGEDADDKPSYTPNSLRGFIGQQHITKVLLKEIAIAKKEGRKHLDNILLFGNPGLGKTTLMELIAKELGVTFELLDCSQFRNSQQSLKALQNFFMRIARSNEPVVIALDEIHMLNNELQSSLLTLLNNRVYVSPLDVNGQCKRIPIDEFTFIAATTDDDKVLETIKNRCLRLKFQMVDYTPDELKQIYKNKIAARGLTITEEALDTCIPRSRGAIRYVNSIVDGLNNALYNDEGERTSTHIDLETALRYFHEKGIDAIGLEKKDLEILQTIRDDTTGAISADVLSARVGLDTKKYLSEYERYLIKIGFISVSGRGRSLTEKAMEYLKKETGSAS